MSWVRYLNYTDASQFEPALQSVSDWCGLFFSALPDGVSEFTTRQGRISVAFSAEKRFLSLQWLLHGEMHEVAFVCPATKKARLTYTGLSVGDPSLPEALRAWFVAPPTDEKIPSHTALVAVYQSPGGIHLHTSDDLSPAAQSELDYLKQLLAEQSDALRQARAALRDSRKAQETIGGAQEEAGAAEAADAAIQALENLSDWYPANEERLVVLPRARNGAKKSKYEKPDVLRQALELLAGAYRDYRLGLLPREAWERELRESGLRLSGSISSSEAGSQGDAYFVQWGGRRQFLDFHLIKGTSRDERFCMRVYFFWDAQSARVVVGSMPAHLSCSIS